MKRTGLAAAGVVASLSLAAIPSAAQEDAGGGISLTFGVGLRASVDENLSLSVPSAGRTARTSADLSFGFLTETRVSRLALDGAARFQLTDDGARASEGLTDPSIQLTYNREGYDSSFDFSAGWRSVDLTGTLEVDDFDISRGSRDTATAAFGFDFAKSAPFGYGFRVEYQDLSYRDDPTATLADSTTLRLRVDTRFDLSETTRLTFGVTQSQFDEEGARRRDTTSVNARLALARPDGDYSVRLALANTEDGDRKSLYAGRSFDLPRGQLSFELGVTQGVTGDTGFSGSVDYNQQLPDGALSFSLDRSVTSDSQDSETTVSRAGIGYTKEISELASVDLSFNWAESKASLTGLTTTNAVFNATYSHALTQDWALDVGYRHRLRDREGIGQATSNGVFVAMRRVFEMRF